MLAIRNNAHRAREIISIFYVVIAFSVFNILSTGWQYLLLVDVEKNPENLDMDEINTSDTVQGVLAVATIIVSLLTIIYFIRWFRRAYNNVHAIPGAQVSLSEGWAAGSWFIPILNLFRPFQIMKETWYETQRAIPHRIDGIQSTGFVGIWWAAYLIMTIYNNFTFRFSYRAETLSELITARKLEIIGEFISIPAAVLTILLIKKMSVFENELRVAAESPDDSVFSLYTEPADV